MKAVLLWASCNGVLIFVALASKDKAGVQSMCILGLLLSISAALMWNICRNKKG